MKPAFFRKPSNFRTWLRRNHKKKTELWVGFYKKSTGISSITWPESVDQALAFGWIDGIRKSIDEKSYKIRFTPRKPDSHWSDVNIRRVKELKRLGLMEESGLAAYAKRKAERSRRASYEQKSVRLDPLYERKLRKNKKAWKFFQAQPPSYRKTCIWWVMSAKKVETQERRLSILIDSSKKGEVVPPLKWTNHQTASG